MPTYYVSGHSPSGHHRARSYSQSYQPAPQVVYTSPRDTRRSTSNRDHNHGSHNHGHGGTGYTYAAPQYVHHTSPSYAQQYSTGNGGVYYATSAPAAAQYGTPAVRYTTSTHHRSHSVPRRPVQVVDARRHHNQPAAFADSGHHRPSHRRYSYDEPSVGDRLRHLFGFGPSMHHEPSRRADYRDPRTGRTVDWRGRPIYRV